MTQEIAVKNGNSLVGKIAERYGVSADKLLPTLKQTAFRQKEGHEVSNEQMMALLIVSDQYMLNPFTKEIFAYPDKGGIVPVVSVDGWNRIINSNPNMDGIEFIYSPETLVHKGKTCHVWIDCIIHRKDRSKPTIAREFFAEVVRNASFSTPWDTHPCRMHRHKAEIQCARIAFGFAGIYDQDEAERIMEAQRPENTSPVLASFSAEQKAYFDNLISQSNAIEMFVFTKTLDEDVFTNLYHSFEKGTKGKYQTIIKNLIAEGSAKVKEYTETIEVAAIEGHDLAALELVEGLTDSVIEFIQGQLSHEASRFLRDAIKQSKPE